MEPRLNEYPEGDRLQEFAHPRETQILAGHVEAEQAILDLMRTGKLPHALLISGAAGIGKATFAYRIARMLFKYDQQGAGARDTLDVSIDDPVFRQVASLGHPDLVVVRRPYDEKTKKVKRDITVEEVRRLQPFFGMKAGAGGWRIAIIDCADDMNISAANALLKILEEPPEKSLLMLISHAPHRLLPTIRSRCRNMPLKPLSDANVGFVLANAEQDGLVENVSEADRQAISLLSEGSAGRALVYAGGGGLDLYKDFIGVLHSFKSGDYPVIRDFASRFGGKKGEGDWAIFRELLPFWLVRVVQSLSGAKAFEEVVPGEAEIFSHLARFASPIAWVELWERTCDMIDRCDAVNLDRMQVTLNILFDTRDNMQAAA